MSTPPLVNPPAMPTMVSRLPKFGSRPRSSTSTSGDQAGLAAAVNTGISASTRLTNGFYHHPGPSGVKTGLSVPPSSVTQNGFIRVPTSFSMKWRKGNRGTEECGAEAEGEWQVRRQPSPTLTSNSTVSCSNSFKRPSDRGIKDLMPSSRGNAPKLPLTRQASGGGAKGGSRAYGDVKVQTSGAPGRPANSSLLPPSALKKPLLPNLGSTSKPSGISYKLSRPSLIKQPRPLRVTPAVSPGSDPVVKPELTGRKNSVETPSTTENSPGSTPEAPQTEGLSAESVSQEEVSIVGEMLEDMSLSSTSSLDRNDTSQEYMDDFDNLGNGGVETLLLSSKNDEDDSGLDQSYARFDRDKLAINGINDVTKATGLCSFLEDSLDWDSGRLSGEQDNQLTRLSHQPDYQDQGGSSLDLSPSDSCGSGGTYMWDEEGLEPLGGAATTASINTNSNTTYHIGSFDSDLNSIDILNNLDSCDLDDDDLMLDVDLPEDVSLHGDEDGMSHMAQWRRRQICWGTQDVHNDNSDFQCFQLTEDPGNKRTDQTQNRELILDLFSPSSPGLCLGAGLGFDVEELAEDCSAVRSQLEYLKSLLLQEEDMDEDTLTTETLSPEMAESSHSSDSQVQDLLQEVQQLREELRSRDRTIAQLTKTLTAPTAPTRLFLLFLSSLHPGSTSVPDLTEENQSPASPPILLEKLQVLHSSSYKDQKPLTDPVPAPPPADPHPDQTRTHADPPPRLQDPPNTKTEGGEDARRTTRVEERKRTHFRSLQLLPPSKLRLFQSQTSGYNHARLQVAALSSGLPGPASTTNIPPPKTTRTTRQPSVLHSPEAMNVSGLKSFSSSSSRLPKPKSH
ncbi:hypothetical protein LDENG_00124870 [Lucifuga dentata]|nr:hypothetical protein LDENG_00124870 [Lucifuga dentata]